MPHDVMGGTLEEFAAILARLELLQGQPHVSDAYVVFRIELLKAQRAARRALVAGSFTYAVRGNDRPVFRDALALPYVPVTALTSLTYVSASTGATVALSASDFVLRNYEGFAFVAPVVGVMWPTDAEEIRVTYTCGYAAADVPVDIKLALLLSLAEWYDQREDVEQQTIGKASRALLAPWRVRWFE